MIHREWEGLWRLATGGSAMSALESHMPPVNRAQVNGIELAYY